MSRLHFQRIGIAAHPDKPQSRRRVRELLRLLRRQRLTVLLEPNAAALAAFISDPGRLTLRLAPAKPVNLMTWSDLAETNPTAALAQINFSLTTD